MSSQQETMVETVELDVTVRPPTDGPWSFNPLDQTIADGELKSGTPFKIQTEMNENGLMVSFGGFGSDNRWEVSLTATDILHAAQNALPEEGRQAVKEGTQ